MLSATDDYIVAADASFRRDTIFLGVWALANSPIATPLSTSETIQLSPYFGGVIVKGNI
jgi:hypothetical protein